LINSTKTLLAKDASSTDKALAVTYSCILFSIILFIGTFLGERAEQTTSRR